MFLFYRIEVLSILYREFESADCGRPIVGGQVLR